MSPSALIPFCEFGGNMSVVGVKIDQFDVPVCNSFQARILRDQLCYEVDLNKFSDKRNIVGELKLGFNFIMDYNEDRQVSQNQEDKEPNESSLVSNVVWSDDKEHAHIYLDTLGNRIETKVMSHINF